MSPRRGLSLTEVLVAIFVMAIGMISLLALFPVGLLRMNQAIRDNRLAQLAANATEIAEWRSLRTDPTVVQAVTSDTRLWDVNTNSPLFTGTCPVYVDPIGSALYPRTAPVASTSYGAHVGQGTTFGGAPLMVNGTPQVNIGIPRSYCSFAPSGSPASNLARWFMMEDELMFNVDGTAVTGPLSRERRYSFAYTWRRPVWSEPAVAEVAIVLYSGRQTSAVGISQTQAENAATGPLVNNSSRVFIAGSRNGAIQLPAGNNVGLVRPGYWVFDATLIHKTNPLPDQWFIGGHWYQVVSAQDPANGVQAFEIDRPAVNDGYVVTVPFGVVGVIQKSDGKTPY
jgi:hypothetical protein